MVISLEQGASDLHVVQLMLLPDHRLCFSKILNGYPSGTSLLMLSWKRQVKSVVFRDVVKKIR